MRRGGNVHITDGATACPWSAFGLFLPDATGRFGSTAAPRDRQHLAHFCPSNLRSIWSSQMRLLVRCHAIGGQVRCYLAVIV